MFDRAVAVLQVLKNRQDGYPENFKLHRKTVFKRLKEDYSEDKNDYLVLDWLVNSNYVTYEKNYYRLVKKGHALLNEIWDAKIYDKVFILLEAKASTIPIPLGSSDLALGRDGGHVVPKVLSNKYIDEFPVPNSPSRYKISSAGKIFWHRDGGYTGSIAAKIENEYLSYKNRPLDQQKFFQIIKAFGPLGTLTNTAISLYFFGAAVITVLLASMARGCEN
jgi:hypothetical protein